MAIPRFPAEQLEQIARCLADARTHAQLSQIFERLGFVAPGKDEGPKWFRIREALRRRQESDGVGNNVGAFIQELMTPVSFVGERERFGALRSDLNQILAFSGIKIDKAGKLVPVQAARTLEEAEARARELRTKLVQRGVHSEVLRFCRAELLDGNYFHAVLEATKSIAERIRTLSGLSEDGAELVQRALGGKRPLVAINSLQSETECSEQRGFANLLVGLFGTFRNPVAHAPKIQWPVAEQDALDLLGLVSYVHRRLDAAVRTHYRAG